MMTGARQWGGCGGDFGVGGMGLTRLRLFFSNKIPVSCKARHPVSALNHTKQSMMDMVFFKNVVWTAVLIPHLVRGFELLQSSFLNEL
jgi:hypothetical protein